MKAGVLGTVAGSFSVVDSFSDTIESDGVDLSRCLEIDRVFSLPSGEPAFEGTAAIERVTTRRTTSIEAGRIVVEERDDRTTIDTRLAGVPGEFVVIESSRGEFGFEFVGEGTSTTVERARIDLDAYLDAHGDGDPWKAGFYGGAGSAESGVLHGDDLLDDETLTTLLDDSTLNQLGLTHESEGGELKLTATESGYVEVYRPRSFDTGEFLEYLRAEIIPHLK